MTGVQRALRMMHDGDPSKELMDKVGPLAEQVVPIGSQVLVAVYIRPDRTKGGIILTDRVRDEDVWQGKVGLIIKMGPLAFVEDETHRWGGASPKVGDWVAFRVSDAWQLLLGEHPCRLIEDVNFRMVLHSPDVVI